MIQKGLLPLFWWIPLMIGLIGCATEDGSDGPECNTQQIYNPQVLPSLDLWPDTFLTNPDENSSTGIRLSPSIERAKWIGTLNPVLGNLILDAEGYTGFARIAKIIIHFNHPVANLPENAAESVSSDALMLFELGSESNRRVPYSIEEINDAAGGVRLIINTLETLRPATEYVLIGTRELQDTDGGCISPAPLARSLISGKSPAPEYDNAARQYKMAIEKTGYEPKDVVIAVPFITHDELSSVVAARDHAENQTFEFIEPPQCFDEGSRLRCEGRFEASDYRDESKRFITDGDPKRQYILPFTVWFPTGVTGPFPTMLYGHGLSGSRHSATWLATDLTRLGMAIVAIDALYHGDHPTADLGGSNGALQFLGVIQNGLLLDGRAQRGHFNQVQLDRIQFIQLLIQNPDLTGDGEPDLQFDDFAYWGISFGGLHGPGTLALQGNIDAAILSVPGGNLTQFITENQMGELAIPIVDVHLEEFGGFLAFLAVAQTIVDPGDPATWAAHVMRDRLVGQIPHLLMATAEFDGTVPPETAYSLARGLGIPQVSPFRTAVDPLPSTEGPVSLNFEGVTAGYFQLDRIDDGETKAAGHNVPESVEALTQSDHFWETWRQGTPEIIDPYPIVGTPPLVEDSDD